MKKYTLKKHCTYVVTFMVLFTLISYGFSLDKRITLTFGIIGLIALIIQIGLLQILEFGFGSNSSESADLTFIGAALATFFQGSIGVPLFYCSVTGYWISRPGDPPLFIVSLLIPLLLMIIGPIIASIILIIQSTINCFKRRKY